MGPRSRVVMDCNVPTATSGKTNSESRKLRNRLSQKAFRARQAMRIKELEERVESEPISDAVRTAQLSERNASLRNQLLDCHKKIRSLQISMQTLAESTALALGLDTLSDSQPKKLCSRCQRPKDGEDRQLSPDEGYSSHTSRGELEQLHEESGNQAEVDYRAMQLPGADCIVDSSTSHLDQSLPAETPQGEATVTETEHMFLDHDRQQTQQSANILDYCSHTQRLPAFSSNQSGQLVENNGNGDFIQILQSPLAFSFKDIGFQQYTDLAARSPSVSLYSQLPLRRTNSLFSDHLSAIEYFLHQMWLKRSPEGLNDDQFADSIKFMISAFVSVSWQTMTAWHTYTKAHIPLKELTAWRVTQTTEAYMKIIPSYRPTKLQMSVKHPAIIDWIPWPALRDKLILHHSANPCLDDVICDIGNSYVIPCDLSRLVANLPAMVGYVSVWDLVRSIAPDATSPDSDRSENNSGIPSAGYFTTSNGPCAYNADTIQNIIDDADKDSEMYSTYMSLPAPNKATLFGSKALSIQAFKLLGMDQGAATFFLDPEFFGRHPELYDPHCDIMASGVPLRPNNQTPIPIPKELNASVVGQYRELSRWAFDLSR